MVDEIESTLRRRLLRFAVRWLALATLALAYLGAGSADGAAGAAAVPASASASASTSGLSVAGASGGAHQYVFWRGSDGRIYEAIYKRAWHGALKTPWFSNSAPSAAVGPHGALYLTWQGAGDHIYETSYAGGKWTRPQDLTASNHWKMKGRATSAVSLAVNPASGTRYLVWRGTDGRIHEAWYTGKWRGPAIMPWRSPGAPAAAVTRTGQQYVFWAGRGGDIEEAWSRGAWHGPLDLTSAYGWGEFGQAVSKPGIGVNPVNDSQYLFWTAADGRIYEAWFARAWHGPLDTGWSTGSAPALEVSPSSHQYVFWQGADGTIWESWHEAEWRGPIAPLRRSKGTGAEVQVAQTSADLSERLARLPSVRFGRAPAPGVPVIDVDDSVRYQRFTGTGGAMTDSSAWLIYDELSPATREALMNDLFGSDGIHLGFTMVPMGGSDFTRTGQPYTYDDLPAGQTDPQLAQFSIAHDQPYILPALREMLAINPQTTVMATPWTAPPWMKANDAYGDLGNAGTLLSSDYQPFANYFVKFLQAYAAQGVAVAAVVPENEPNSGAPFPAMSLPPSNEAQWITQNLDPALQQANLQPRLYGGDVGWAGPGYPSQLLSSQANGALTGIAWHCYGGLPTVMSNLHEQVPADDQIVTECAQGIQPYPVPEVLISSLRNWSSVVTLWNLALDPSGGPVEAPNAGCTGCTGEVTINEATHTVSFRPSYFQLGQVSAFVAPGAMRIGSNSFVGYYQNSSTKYGVTPGLDDVAFLNPDGTRVLIAYDNSTVPIRFAVDWDGGSFTYSLPAKAMVTFSWRP